MIHEQFLVPSHIDIVLYLQAYGYSDRYINDHRDKYHYLLHKILEGRIFNREIGIDGYTQLNFRKLESFIGARYARTILDELLFLGIIQRDRYYIKGEKSYGYRIAPTYVSKGILIDIFKMETMTPKLLKQRAEYQKTKMKLTTWKNLTQIAIHRQQAVDFINAKFNATMNRMQSFEYSLNAVIECEVDGNVQALSSLYSSFIKYWKKASCPAFTSLSYEHTLSEKKLKKALHNPDNQGHTLYTFIGNTIINQYNADLESIQKIAKSDFFVEQPDPKSRVYTNLSNLSTDLRQFLFLKKTNQRLVNCDIRNSQPYLFSLLLMDEYAGKVLPADVKLYIELTATGRFYEHVMTLLGVPHRERSAFKQHFFATIFFCSSYYSVRTKEGKLFQSEFPNVYELINRYKVDSHADLAIAMQRREAEVVLKTIGGQLSKKKIWYSTIHDSVVVTQEHAEQVKKLILAAFFEAVGVSPSVNEEVLTTSL